MTTPLFLLTVALYVVSSTLSFLHLARGDASTGRLSAQSLAAAITTHTAFLFADHLAHGRVLLNDIHQTLAILSLLTAVGFLVAMRNRRLRSLAAFVTPVILLIFLGAGIKLSVGSVPRQVESVLLPVHIGVNVLGIVAFALAFAVAAAYLIQERLLRARKISGVFQRLPALDVLDSLGLRLVTIGFPLFTVGVVTGSVWAARMGGLSFSTGQGFAVLAWACFAVVLIARLASGWRGRRAAIGTMFGFLCAMAALLGYVLRDIGST
jgi:ABC-type uncharacterized transport system permease subunit